MMRLNRLRWLIRWHSEHGMEWFWAGSKRSTWPLWLEEKGLIEVRYAPGLNGNARLTPNGLESLRVGILEHEAKGSFAREASRT